MIQPCVWTHVKDLGRMTQQMTPRSSLDPRSVKFHNRLLHVMSDFEERGAFLLGLLRTP